MVGAAEKIPGIGQFLYAPLAREPKQSFSEATRQLTEVTLLRYPRRDMLLAVHSYASTWQWVPY